MLIRNLLDGGWVNTNSSLGAPFGQELYDFPLGTDNLNLLVLKVLAVVTRDPAVAMNLSSSSPSRRSRSPRSLVLRRLGLSRPAAFACRRAVRVRAVPLLARARRTCSCRPTSPCRSGRSSRCGRSTGKLLFARREQGRLRWLSRRSLGTLALCAVIALDRPLLRVLHGAARRRRRRRDGRRPRTRRDPRLGPRRGRRDRGRRARQRLSVARVHGRQRRERGARHPVGRRVGAVRAQADPTAPPRRRPPARAARAPRAALRPDDDHAREPARVGSDPRPRRQRRLRRAAFRRARRCRRRCAVAAARRCSGTRRCRRSSRSCSGSRPAFATLFAYAVTPKLHAPARISIFIAFFSLLAVGVLLDAGVRRWAGRRKPKMGRAGGGRARRRRRSRRPDHATVRAALGRGREQRWRADEAYAHAARDALPEGQLGLPAPVRGLPGKRRSRPDDRLRRRAAVRPRRRAPLELRRDEGPPARLGRGARDGAGRSGRDGAAAAGFDALELDRDAYVERAAGCRPAASAR